MSTIRNIITFFLLVVMILRAMAMPVACLNYSVNKKEISGKYCINKARPSMNCNGQCFLKNQLEKANESDQSADDKVVKNTTVEWIFENDEPHTLQMILTSTKYPAADFHYSYRYFSSVYHPPA